MGEWGGMEESEVWKQEGTWEGERRGRERRQRQSEGERDEDMRKCEAAQGSFRERETAGGQEPGGQSSVAGKGSDSQQPCRDRDSLVGKRGVMTEGAPGEVLGLTAFGKLVAIVMIRAETAVLSRPLPAFPRSCWEPSLA